MAKVISSKIVGEAEGASDQIHEFQDGENTLFVAVSTARATEETPVDLLLTIRSVAKSLWDDFLKKKENEESMYVALKLAVLEASKHFSSESVTIDIGAIYVSDLSVYFAVTTGFDVFLLREGAHRLTKRNDSIRGGSGKIEQDDLVVLTTDRFERLLPQERSWKPFEEISDDIRARVSSSDASGVVLLLQIKAESAAARLLEPIDQALAPKIGKKLSFNPSSFFNRPNIGIFIPKSESEFIQRTRSKKTTIAGAILVFILFISIFWGIHQNGVRQARDSFKNKVSSVQKIIDDAEKSGSLAKAQTRELLVEAQNELNTFTDKEKKETSYTNLSEKIKTDLATLTGLNQVEPQNFLDLTLQSANFSGKALAYADDVLYILDATKNKVISVNIDSKRTESAGSTDGLGNISRVLSYSDRIFATTNDGLYEISGKPKQLLSKDWQDPELFYIFASNLYRLSQSDNSIYRYSGTTDGFGDKNTWIAPNVEVHIENAVGWSIDGTIWVLSKGGRIARFTQGLPQIVSLSGVTGNITNATKIMTNEDLNNLYILDPENSRIVVFDKKGAFVSEYVADELKDTTDLVVSEKLGKIVLLNNSKLLVIPLSEQ